jgi:hypothetical protein
MKVSPALAEKKIIEFESANEPTVAFYRTIFP